ncbi:MAG TPA: glycosyltransferase family 4 protein [Patescibacteria group bacterium]|nr:glycosyltransferase family 4 protein [Patescibacteria group bacterium]
MARINIVMPGFSPRTFSGGLWSLMEFASGLAARGHDVTVVPVLPCRHKPGWFLRPAGRIVTSSPAERCGSIGVAAKACAAALLAGQRRQLRAAIGELACAALTLQPSLVPEELRVGVACHYLNRALPPADATLATASWTALPVRLSGQGRLLYFMQHYEPYFFDGEGEEERVAKREAEISYGLGLEMIANSSWLKKKIETEFPHTRVRLCHLAVDHSLFHGEPREPGSGGTTTVISYSGRRAAWKGFREMAEAVKIARNTLRGTTIRWLVYGPAALLPPDNPVAPYEWLGFLQPPQLAEAYRSADLLLSASWYESFPLFTLEAMACGLPVVTTPLGTEDYAIPGETAEVVAPRDPRNIAAGLIRLIQDSRYRRRIAGAGREISREFTWGKSVSAMEEILVRAVPESSPAPVPLGACR